MVLEQVVLERRPRQRDAPPRPDAAQRRVALRRGVLDRVRLVEDDDVRPRVLEEAPELRDGRVRGRVAAARGTETRMLGLPSYSASSEPHSVADSAAGATGAWVAKFQNSMSSENSLFALH